MKKTVQTLKGFRDFMPQEAAKRKWLADKMIQAAQTWGYQPIETPTLEPLELFAGEIGEDEKLFFKFKDYGDREIALRYDQTVPTCRFISNHLNDLIFPFRRYQLQSVFRAEKPQKGRYREFAQFDLDIFGVASPIADAEIIALNIATYLDIGFKNVVINIGSRSLMKNIPYEAIVAIDKLEKIGKEAVIKEMIDKNISQQKAENYMKQVENLEPDETLKIIFKYLKDSGYSQANYRFEPTLARSFSYSDGPIWEIKIPEYLSGSVGGGERYDGMMERITGQKIPGTGIAYGFDRTLEAADELGLIPLTTTLPKVLVSVFDDNLLPFSLKTANSLKVGEIWSEVYPDFSTKLAKQFKYANQKGIPFVVVIGEEEVKQNKVTLKNMETGDQQLLTVDEVISSLTS